jgi:hypothetical protein
MFFIFGNLPNIVPVPNFVKTKGLYVFEEGVCIKPDDEEKS